MLCPHDCACNTIRLLKVPVCCKCMYILCSHSPHTCTFYVTSLPVCVSVPGIEPSTHSKGMISWFPIFFPLQVKSVNMCSVASSPGSPPSAHTHMTFDRTRILVRSKVIRMRALGGEPGNEAKHSVCRRRKYVFTTYCKHRLLGTCGYRCKW